MVTNNSKLFSRTLLMVLVISGVVLVAAANPYFGIKAIGIIQKELKKRKWRQFHDNLYYLRRKGFINMKSNSDGSYIVQATKLGRVQAHKYSLDGLFIEVPKSWDGYWRLVVFDIPTDRQKARFALLAKLKRLGFIMLQRSIWVHPFECQKEVNVLAKAFKIERYIHQITCHQISAGESLRHNFEKRNSIRLI